MRRLPEKIRAYFDEHGASAPSPAVHMKCAVQITVKNPVPEGQLTIDDDSNDDRRNDNNIPGSASLPATLAYPLPDAVQTLAEAPLPDTLPMTQSMPATLMDDDSGDDRNTDDDRSTVLDTDTADHRSDALEPEGKRRRMS